MLLCGLLIQSIPRETLVLKGTSDFLHPDLFTNYLPGGHYNSINGQAKPFHRGLMYEMTKVFVIQTLHQVQTRAKEQIKQRQINKSGSGLCVLPNG